MKKLALMLALCLLLSSVPAIAPAEETGLTVVELEPVALEQTEAAPVEGPVAELPEGALPVFNDGEELPPHTDPEGPVLVASAVTLGAGESFALEPALPEGVGGGYTCASADAAVATVSETGVVTAVAPGQTVVTVTADSGAYAECFVTVEAAPQTLAFEADSVRLGVGMQLPLAASVDAGAHGEIAYSLSREGYAAYDQGVLTGVKRGRVTLVARTYNGLTAKCRVVVVSAPRRVTLPYETLELGVGQTLRLTPDVGKSASTYAFSSSRSKVVSVDENGTLTALKRGSATVTVKTYNKKKAKVKVTVLKAPRWIRLAPETAELCVGQTLELSHAFPTGAAGSVTYASDNAAVAEVDPQSGVVTAISEGTAAITATTHNGKTANAFITVLPAPQWVEAAPGMLELGVGMIQALDVTLSPGSFSPLVFASDDPAVAQVNEAGVVTAIGKGETTVTVQTVVPEVRCAVSVTVKAAPKRVTLDEKALTLNVGETTQLDPVIPEGALTVFTYESSDTDVATVSAEGMVTAVGRGEARLTVRTHNGKSASMTLTVEDPYFPERVVIQNVPDVMRAGETLKLELSVTPGTALAELEWSSSNEGVAYVDGDDVLHAVNLGYAVLSATSRRNGDITLEFSLIVDTEEVVLTIPARITDIDGIPHNLELIENLHAAAVRQIGLLYVGGTITQADALKRKSMVDNAFKDYAFPWMTPKLQKYWKAENSEGGVKDFKPNRVYYGMPYISGSGSNRQYNRAKALSEGRYTDTGEGYYLLNQDRLLNGKYCGNDCSCFVDAAIWGTSSSHSADRTAEIAVSSAYRTVNSFNAMRTGDLICKGYAHVVMFLYYVNPEKTKIMIIENGGIEPGTNTVHCMIMDLSFYTSAGYRVRRLASLG